LFEADRGLERFKRVKDSGLNPAYCDEKTTLFEIHRASPNGHLCNNIESDEHRDAARFEKKHREHEKSALDEVQVHQELRAVEERRRMEGTRLHRRFFAPFVAPCGSASFFPLRLRTSCLLASL
jgi:hypothetical protein